MKISSIKACYSLSIGAVNSFRQPTTKAQCTKLMFNANCRFVMTLPPKNMKSQASVPILKTVSCAMAVITPLNGKVSALTTEEYFKALAEYVAQDDK